MMNDKDDIWNDFKKIGDAMAERENDLDKLAETCEYDMKLAVTRWAMKHVVEHARDGGSYRYLIYDRLGFGPDAYAPLCSDGLIISNEFDLELKEEIREVVIENGYDLIKPIIDLCDEPKCYRRCSCGWPTEDGGYRRTCYEHMTKDPWKNEPKDAN